ncbi:uncharacterized protein LOC115100103 isoform X2 [Rhinatrema bivittatum]|uniref:uncharacterized protein LOC115100103 isoform X2 n=1 Tax=Rhinatrema bivittatum TaxID=194408 RepID=UPI0011287000|nr:uncharacterized protein LOC115100103 isoform X2 [Rhinatrema bivittatum]
MQESSGFDLEQGMLREGKQVIEDRDIGDMGNFGGWPDWYGKESCRGMVPSSGPVGFYGREGHRKGGQFPSRGGFEGRVRHEVSEGSLGRERGASFLAGPEEEVMPGTSRQEAWRDREFAGLMTGQDSGSSRRGGWHAASGQEKEVPVEAELRVRRGEQECAWVVDHSFVHWAHHRAERRPYGSNLYLEELQWSIKWFSWRGMKWDGLLTFLQQCVMENGVPQILLIHLGGNDIGKWSCREMVSKIRKDFATIMNGMPHTVLGWSDIIVRYQCLDSPIWYRGVRKLNKQIGKWLERQGGFWVKHEWSREVIPGLFRSDGVHLSDVGINLFNNTLQEGLEQVIARIEGRSGGEQ